MDSLFCRCCWRARLAEAWSLLTLPFVVLVAVLRVLLTVRIGIERDR